MTSLSPAEAALARAIPPANPATADVLPATNQDPAGAVRDLTRDWATIKYQMHDDDAQARRMRALLPRAADLAARYPGRAEPLILQGLILGSVAGYERNADSLALVRQARDLFVRADRIDPAAMDGAAAVNLGSLYYLVPGFPLSFGDDDKARTYLERGIALSPDGLESNYFYGEFLSKQGEYERAAKVLAHALAAPVSAQQPVWDAGRREEARALLAEVRQKLMASG